MKRIELKTAGNGLVEITQEVRRVVEESGLRRGAAVLWVPHTTAGLTVISRMDVLGFADIEEETDRLIPTRVNFKHQFDTPTDAAGHIKSALFGVGQTVIVEDGTLRLGSSQGIFFFEFDGPRRREVWVQLLPAETGGGGA